MIENISKAQIVWPQEGVIPVTPDVDFIYILRKDIRFTCDPLAQKLAKDEGGMHHLQRSLYAEYDAFTARLTDKLLNGFAHKGNIQVHIFDPDILDQATRAKSIGIPLISLDPLMNKRVYQHQVSRGYYLGGVVDFGQVSRPRTQPLPVQAAEIASALNGTPAAVCEDDIFSGGSTISAVHELTKNRVKIAKIIPGIQIGQPQKLLDMGIPLEPIVKYETTDGTDIFDKVDLGDPRDYLVGISGLVVKLPDGSFGRSPYTLPFVSPTARAGIPVETEKQFSLDVLKANHEFYRNIGTAYNREVLLKHVDHDFHHMMTTLFGFKGQVPMHFIIEWAAENMDKIWELNKAKAEEQQKGMVKA